MNCIVCTNNVPIGKREIFRSMEHGLTVVFSKFPSLQGFFSFPEFPECRNFPKFFWISSRFFLTVNFEYFRIDYNRMSKKAEIRHTIHDNWVEKWNLNFPGNRFNGNRIFSGIGFSGKVNQQVQFPRIFWIPLLVIFSLSEPLL